MNTIFKTTLTLSIAAILSYSAYATTNKSTDYELVAYNDCEIVYRATLSPKQKAAYDLLNQESAAMKELELPIQTIQPTLDKLTKEMKEVSLLAVSETDNILRIDKNLIDKQNELAKKIDNLIRVNQPNFDALEAQGKRIEIAAKEFESLMPEELEQENYRNVQIVTDQQTLKNC